MEKLPEVEVDLDAMRADVVAELTELEKYEQACKAMYTEMRHWHDKGFTLLLMERDGENLKLRPVY